MKMRVLLFAAAIAAVPPIATSQTVELTQAQLRQLVVEQQIISAEDIVAGVAQNFGGNVKDIRGFYADGRMTYRLLLQRQDGQVVEILVNGVDGRQVSHTTPLGQSVSAVARATNGSSSASANQNSNGNSANSNSQSNGNSNSSGGNGRGNGNGNSNSGGNGNSNSGGNGNGNSGGNGNGRKN